MHSEVEIQHAQPGAQPVAQPVAASHDDRSEAALELAKYVVNFIRFISEEIVLKVLAASANRFSLDPSSQPVMVSNKGKGSIIDASKYNSSRTAHGWRNGMGGQHL